MFARVTEDAKAFAKAEFELQKARAAVEAAHYRSSVILAVVALAAFHLALIALTVGVVVAIADWLNGWAATAIVTIGYLLIAAITGYLARARLAKPRS